ncbi:UNKNOWN [Stylonychia lemnae]|uniref:Uncharacterized protein n=1 Tax=Stylonychia lemnae TaxID=5949 RepID=A0A078AVT8_STYLE|nr:UNKNOWN [Stylonychia lemnae]|eukprot:CDW86294.1 UNKNOWN [Stylonychia lemnae]
MIAEREQLLLESELKKVELFPKFIVVRKQINNQSDEAGEWQGFIKDIKSTIRTTSAKLKGEIIQNMHSSLGKIDEGMEQNQKIIGLQEDLGNQIIKMKETYEAQYGDKQSNNLSVNQKVEALDAKVDSIHSQGKELNSKVEGLDSKVEGLDSKVMKLQDDMGFIKDSLTKLLQKQYKQ